ncbi:transposase [candidate division WOR-3 bacterium]|nr:transposase [candidate division WOR-3 bacterium]
MRKPRFTYQGAVHYIVSRSLQGKKIFPDDFYVFKFLSILEQRSSSLKIDLFAFCVTPNSFHLLLKNSSGRLSDFMRQVNGIYASHFRKKAKSKNRLFQDRYESFVVQDERYMKEAVAFILNVPVAVKIAEDPFLYRWTSANFYFNKKQEFLETKCVERLFNSRDDFRCFVKKNSNIQIKKTFVKEGKILGDGNIEGISRDFPAIETDVFMSAEDAVRRIEEKRGVYLDSADFRKREWKNIRSELLVTLKEECGLSYGQIIEQTPFRNLKESSLGQLYKRAKLLKRRGT